MAKAQIVDYYAVLAIPPSADLTGIQNAYARLSDETARLIGEDDTIQEGILRLNEAYSILSNPETRRKYDQFYFSGEREATRKQIEHAARSRAWAARALVGILALVVMGQIAALGYMAREEVKDVTATVLGPLFPDDAG